MKQWRFNITGCAGGGNTGIGFSVYAPNLAQALALAAVEVQRATTQELEVDGFELLWVEPWTEAVPGSGPIPGRRAVPA